ncbi:MAG: TetR/AcrR family transcriptional regulator [Candidatus Leucobacter sulfamidivorax]|nr:TetR/AcrR family transcriptional regulator [Candidatus Leucobacter sulfamidivorax]
MGASKTPSDRSTPPQSPRKQERRNRDNSVMKEAIAIMAEKGYAATSIQEVADRVGVLKGSLYHYFNSKEELLFRILEESYLQMNAIEAEVDELELPPFDALLEQIRRSSVWFLQNQERAHIFFTETKHLTDDRLTQAREWGRAFERRLSSLIVAGQEAGSIRSDVDQRLLTRFTIGAINNIRFWPSRPGGKQFTVDDLTDGVVLLVGDALKS